MISSEQYKGVARMQQGKKLADPTVNPREGCSEEVSESTLLAVLTRSQPRRCNPRRVVYGESVLERRQRVALGRLRRNR